MDTTMKQVTIAAEIVEENDATYVLRLKTGFGDPIVRVHKDEVKVEEKQ